MNELRLVRIWAAPILLFTLLIGVGTGRYTVGEDGNWLAPKDGPLIMVVSDGKDRLLMPAPCEFTVYIDNWKITGSANRAGPSPGPQPGPDPGPGPEPGPPPLSALGQQAKVWATELVSSDVRARTAKPLADSFDRVAGLIGRELTTESQVKEAVRSANDNALGDDKQAWHEWRLKLGKHLDKLEGQGKWSTATQWKAGFLDVAAGLEQSK